MGGLDPATVAAARAAGIEDSALQDGQVACGKAPEEARGCGRETRPGRGAGLDEDDLAEDLEELNLDEPEPDGSRMEAAVLQLTKIVSTLAHPSRPSKPDLDSVLDAGVSSGSGEQQNLGQGRKSAAALRFPHQGLRREPQGHLRSPGAADDVGFPGCTTEAWGSRLLRRQWYGAGWLASKSRIGNFHNHIRWSWQVAGIWDDLVQNNIDRARARAGLLVACADQASIDSGSWVMSTVALLEPLPPFQEFARHTGPQPAESQISALFDPRWGEVFLQVLKDRESFNEAKAEACSGFQAGVAGESPWERQGDHRGSERARAWPRTWTRPRRKWCPRGRRPVISGVIRSSCAGPFDSRLLSFFCCPPLHDSPDLCVRAGAAQTGGHLGPT